MNRLGKSPHHRSRLARRLVPAFISLLLTGCGGPTRTIDTPLPGVADRLDLLGLPTIHSIGETSIVTYEPGKPFEIKILGSDLHDPDLSWDVSASSIAPLQMGVDYLLRDSHNPIESAAGASAGARGSVESDLALVFSAAYVNRVQSGDPLNITLQVSNNRLLRKYHSIKADIDRIEEHISALSKLQADVTGWLIENDLGVTLLAEPPAVRRHAATTQAPVPARSPEEKRLRLRLRQQLSDGLRPTIDMLTQLHEVTYASRDLVQEILGQLRALDPSQEACCHDLQAIGQRLNELRSVYRDFIRTNTAFAPVVASASRHFILFSAADYRQKFLGSTIPLNEISAFPLPDAQVNRLFGPIVAKEFFVVALSISNFTDQDRLVDTGMIKAAGRALICPNDNTSLGGPTFNYTIPIEVVPQSTEQVYTMVSDSKAHEPREWIFRSLEFVGALATAAATGFSADLDLITGIGLFSGVAIPGAKSLWPDDVPGYLRNVIAFGMPDLVKINGKSTVGHKVLFFSKEKLQLMVSDPLQFQVAGHDGNAALKAPDQFVVQLAFDSLMITYDNIASPTKGTVEERLASARRACDELIAELRQVSQGWTGSPGDQYARQLRYEDWQQLGQWLGLASTAGVSTALPDAQRRPAQELVAAWQTIQALLAPAAIKANLTNHERLGLIALQKHSQELDNAQSAVAGGQPARVYNGRIDSAEQAVTQTRAMLAFHRQAASQLKELFQGSVIQAVGKGSDANTATYAVGTLRSRLAALLEFGKPVQELLALPVLPADPTASSPTIPSGPAGSP